VKNCLFSTPTEGPAHARRVVDVTFEGVAPWVVATARLLASELVTNAIVHGSGEPTLSLDLQENSLRVEVHDSDRTLDLQALEVGVSSMHGRGLAIVNVLASSWGVSEHGEGKSVWFDLDL
jgi:hypothetical protein